MTTDDLHVPDQYDDREPPQLRPPHEMPPITDQRSLEWTWRALVGRPGFAIPQLWLLFIDDHRPLTVVQVDGLPLVPTTGDIDKVGEVLAGIAAQMPGTGDLPALLLARPGPPDRTPGDLAWARGLSALPGTVWPLHLANDVGVRVVAPDDLTD